MVIAIDMIGTNLGSGTKTYNLNFCENLQKINIENIIFIYLPYSILICKSCALCHPFSNLGPPK